MSGALVLAVVAAAAGAAVLVGSPADLLTRLGRPRGRVARPPSRPLPPRRSRRRGQGRSDGRRGGGEGLPGGDRRAADRSARAAVVRRRVALVALAAAVTVLTGSAAVGVAALAGAAVADRVVARLEPAADRTRTARIVAALPAFADLVAATVRAGVPPDRALRVCATVTGGPLGDEVARVVTALELGLAPERAWTGAGAVRGLEPLAHAMVRGQSRGSSPVAVLERCSLDARRIARSAAQARAQAVGVAAAAPLGLCFLPAFVLVSVVPTVVGGLGSLLR